MHDEGCIGEDWAAYSFPEAVFAGGSRLSSLRGEVRTMASDLVGSSVVLREHIERPCGAGLYVRSALDDREPERSDVVDAMRSMVDVGRQRDHLAEQLPLAVSGDAVLVACLPEDTIRWVLEQMDPQDTVAVCTVGPLLDTGRFVYWNYLVREGADREGREDSEESIAEAGLSIDSPISEFVRSTITAGRRGLRLGAGR